MPQRNARLCIRKTTFSSYNEMHAPFLPRSFNQPNLLRLFLLLRVLLVLRLDLLLRLALRLAIQLIWSANRDIFRSVVAEAPLQRLLDYPADAEVEDHDGCNHHLEVVGEGDELELVVEFGDEFGGAGKGDSGDHD